MIPVEAFRWPILDGAAIPDGYDREPLRLGWRSVAPDLRSVHDPSFRWPWPGGWTPTVDADSSDDECAAGLHVAVDWMGASMQGPIRAGLVVAYRSGDVAHEGCHKIRVRQAAVLNVFDAAAVIKSGLFAGADMAGATLAGATLAGATLARVNLAGAALTRVNLAEANLAGATLTRANLAGAALDGANLTGAYLAGAYLTGAYLAGATLTGANLTGVNLAGATLAGATLTGATLDGAYLDGAVWDESTRWPDRFPPPEVDG